MAEKISLEITANEGGVPAALACHRSVAVDPEDAALKVTELARSHHAAEV